MRSRAVVSFSLYIMFALFSFNFFFFFVFIYLISYTYGRTYMRSYNITYIIRVKEWAGRRRRREYLYTPGVHSNVWITNQAAFSDKSQPSGNRSTCSSSSARVIDRLQDAARDLHSVPAVRSNRADHTIPHRILLFSYSTSIYIKIYNVRATYYQ